MRMGMHLYYQETKNVHMVEAVILDHLLNARQPQVQYCQFLCTFYDI